MTRLSHSEFREELDALSSSPGAVPHSVQDGGTLAPTSRIPPEQVSGTRRDARARPLTPNPIGIVGNLIDAVCIPYSLAPETTARALRRTVGGFIVERNWNDGVNQTLQGICRSSPSFEPPLPSRPFNGGQCDGVNYLVRVESARYGSGCTLTSLSINQTNHWGPILGVRLVPVSDPDNSFRSRNVEVFSRGRTSSAISAPGWYPGGAVQNLAGGCSPPYVQNTIVTRNDGQPDNCGEPVPQYRDEGDIVFAPVLDIDIAPGTSINIAPSVTANIDGSINIELPGIGDVNIDIGGIEINFPGGGDDGGNGENPSPRPDPDDTGTDPEDPPPPPPSGEDPDTEEPPTRSERVIRAVLVTVTSVPAEFGRIYQSGNPDVLIPNLGYVNFRVAADGISSGWTDDQPVKNLRHFVVCPWDGGAFDVKGTPRPGVQWTLTPVYDEVVVE